MVSCSVYVVCVCVVYGVLLSLCGLYMVVFAVLLSLCGLCMCSLWCPVQFMWFVYV